MTNGYTLGAPTTPALPFAPAKKPKPVIATETAAQKPATALGAVAPAVGSRTDVNNDGLNDVSGTAIKPMSPGLNPNGITSVPGGVQPVSPGLFPTGGGMAATGGPTPIGPGMFPQTDQSLPPVGSLPTPTLESTLMSQYTGSQPRVGAVQAATDAAAANLGTGPDRTAIAKQAFTDYLSQSNDQFGKDIRAITQRAAAGGRTGSGMYGSDLVDAATAADKNRAYAGNQLAQDLANGTISDRYNTLSALGGLENQRFGQGQTALGNVFNYGQQAFTNQLATQQQKAALDDQQFRQYLALLGLQG